MKKKNAAILENQMRFMSDKGVLSLPDRYGFDWGDVKVRRVASRPSDDGGNYLILTITTPRRGLEITITPTGLIRTHEMDAHQVNLKPPSVILK